MDLLRNLDKPKRALADILLSQNDVAPATAMDEFCNFLFQIWGAPGAYEPPMRTWMEDLYREYAQLANKEWPFADILGPIYMALASNKGKQMSGQFFTPTGVSELLTRMTMQDEISSASPLRLHEPCVGAGSILLAHLRVVLETHGPEALRWVHVHGVDLSWTCARMCAVQIVAPVNIHRFDLGSLEIYQGNALNPNGWTPVIRASRIPDPAVDANDESKPTPTDRKVAT